MQQRLSPLPPSLSLAHWRSVSLESLAQLSLGSAGPAFGESCIAELSRSEQQTGGSSTGPGQQGTGNKGHDMAPCVHFVAAFYIRSFCQPSGNSMRQANSGCILSSNSSTHTRHASFGLHLIALSLECFLALAAAQMIAWLSDKLRGQLVAYIWARCFAQGTGGAGVVGRHRFLILFKVSAVWSAQVTHFLTIFHHEHDQTMDGWKASAL